MVIPVAARKAARIQQGDVVEVFPEGDGRIVLVRLERPGAEAPLKPKIIYRKGTHPVGSTGKVISSQKVRDLLREL